MTKFGRPSGTARADAPNFVACEVVGVSASEVVGEGATVASVPVELEQRRLGVHLDEHAASLVSEGGVDAPREEKLLGGGLDGGVVSGA